jgi:hypothetical protein
LVIKTWAEQVMVVLIVVLAPLFFVYIAGNIILAYIIQPFLHLKRQRQHLAGVPQVIITWQGCLR